MEVKKKFLISVVGPTAVGKTALAIEVARHFGTEIISADSRQFYREMIIGTAKPDKQELAQAKHHFIDSHSIEEYYSVGMFEKDALALLEKLFENHQTVVMVGGSGLFFKAIWDGLDEMPEIDLSIREELNESLKNQGLGVLQAELREKDPEYFQIVDIQNHQRVIRALEVIRSSGKTFTAYRKGHKTAKRDFVNIKIGLNMNREVLFDKINHRMDIMIDHGLFDEAKSLYAYKEHNALQTVGYSEIFDFLDGKYDREEAIRLLKRNSRRYAKRQITWFKKDPETVWFQPDQLDEVIRLIEFKLNT